MIISEVLGSQLLHSPVFIHQDDMFIIEYYIIVRFLSGFYIPVFKTHFFIAPSINIHRILQFCGSMFILCLIILCGQVLLQNISPLFHHQKLLKKKASKTCLPREWLLSPHNEPPSLPLHGPFNLT